MTGAIVQPALFGALSHEDYRIRPDCPVGSRGSCSPGQRTRCQVVLRADGSLLALTLPTRIVAVVDLVGSCPERPPPDLPAVGVLRDEPRPAP